MGWIGGQSNGGRKAREEATVWVKGHKVPYGAGVRRRCCKDGKEGTGRRDLAEISSNMLSD